MRYLAVFEEDDVGAGRSDGFNHVRRKNDSVPAGSHKIGQDLTDAPVGNRVQPIERFVQDQ